MREPNALTRIQDEAIDAAASAGHTGSAVDELIADRRAETARDDAGWSPTYAHGELGYADKLGHVVDLFDQDL